MCLYSAASMLLRSLSAASHSVCSNPSVAPLFPFAFLDDFVDLPNAAPP